MTETVSTRSCPQCGVAFESDPRYSDWCPSCEWNLAEPPISRRTAHRRARELARAEAWYARLAKPGSAGRISGSDLAAAVLASLVHLVTLAVAAGSIWLLLTGQIILMVLGVVGAGLVWLLRPRFGGLREDTAQVTREEAPQLHELIERIADELGVRRPDRLRVQAGYLTTYSRRGVRQEVELTIGLALWTVLTPQQRIAMLARELGHGAVGSPRHGLWLRLALDTLDAWYGLLMPGHGDELMSAGFRSAGLAGYQDDVVSAAAVQVQIRGSAQRALMDGLANRLLLLAALPVRLARYCLHWLLVRGSQQAEYAADDLAVRVASPSAATAMLDALFLEELAAAYLRRQRALVGHGGVARPADIAEALWSGLADSVASVPELEHERRRRLAIRQAAAVDAWHPPTHLRIRRQSERPEQAATILADTVDWTVLHAELEDSRWRTAILVLGI